MSHKGKTISAFTHTCKYSESRQENVLQALLWLLLGRGVQVFSQEFLPLHCTFSEFSNNYILVFLVCMCVHAHECTYGGVCTGMHIEAKGQQWAYSPVTLLFIF